MMTEAWPLNWPKKKFSAGLKPARNATTTRSTSITMAVETAWGTTSSPTNARTEVDTENNGKCHLFSLRTNL